MATKISKNHKSIKHAIIDKANNRTLIAVAVATFVVVFSSFAARALFSQSLYHGRVIGEKEKALKQLKIDSEEIRTLEQSYIAFVNEPVNILGGSPAGNGELDGDNGKIVLDALPSAYDYPALSSSFEKILKDGGYEISSIGGAEDSSVTNTPTGNVRPVEVAYSFSITATTERTTELLKTLEQSIRPMYLDNLRIQVGDNSLSTRISLHTYFTQEKTFELGSKEVK